MKNDVVISDDKAPISRNNGAAGTAVIEVTSQGKSRVRLSGGTETVRLDRVLLVRKAAHNLVSVSGLCDDDHTVLFTRTDCIVKRKNTVAGFGKHTSGINAIELQINDEEAISPPESGGDILHM